MTRIQMMGALAATIGAMLPGSMIAEPTTIRLDRNLTALSEAFNGTVTRTRLVFVVGPTCPVCRKGLEDMKNQVLADLPDDDELAILVVHVPALDAQEKDARQAVELLDDTRAIHFWDGLGTSGIRYQRTLELPSYAWDVWMIYPPGTRWDERDPPAPVYWRHQLQGVDPTRRLDPPAFRRELETILTEGNAGA